MFARQGAECYGGNKGVSDRFQRLPEVVGEIIRDTQDNWEEVPYEGYRESAGSIVLCNEKIGNDPDGYINVEMVKSTMICPYDEYPTAVSHSRWVCRTDVGKHRRYTQVLFTLVHVYNILFFVPINNNHCESVHRKYKGGKIRASE